MSTEYGEDQLRLLRGSAGELYAEAIAAGSLPDDDPRLADLAAELGLLVGLGLLAHDPGAGRYQPVDPATVQARVVTPMGTRAARLLADSASWASTFAGLTLAFRREAPGTPDLQEVRGLPNINAFLTATLADAEFELLTAQPDGARPSSVLREAIDRDLQALERGVRMRTLYQHSARRSQATRQYVDEVVRHGGEVRTLDEFFNRLIVVDRRMAVIPGTGGPDVALAIREPGLVAYLADVFERYWERARIFTDREARTQRAIAADVHNMAIRMLIEGHSDNASAKRVGVSQRTYAGYVAALKDEYGVESRFQLGYAIGQQAAQEARETGREPGDS